MSIQSVADFVKALRTSNLLESHRLDEIAREQRRFADPEALSRHLVERGWLTAYQAQQLLEGTGAPLILGIYSILGTLGRGGMGEVLQARHRRLGRLAALKIIRPDHLSRPDAVERFHREARAAAHLQQPNIVTIYDANEAAGTHFIAMEYVLGTDLARLVKDKGPLPTAQACEYIRQAALGLQHAHEHGLVHRDIKPSNLIVVRAEGSQVGTVKILDFGLARFASELTEDVPITPTDQWLGTPDYVAPEQALNGKAADIRADIFSLGCSLLYLLTGAPPFPGKTPTERLAARLAQEARPLRWIVPEGPVPLQSVLAKMLAREPKDRYQTPAQVAEALEPFCRVDSMASDTTSEIGAGNLRESVASSPVSLENQPVIKPALGGKTPSAALGSDTSATPPFSLPDTRTYPGAQAEKKRHPWFGVLLLGSICTGACILLGILFFGNPFEQEQPSGDPGKKDDGKKAPVTRGPAQSFTNSIGMKLVRIPAGRFRMGSPISEGERIPDEGPQHWVKITRPFYMGVHEVTQKEYRQVMGKNPSFFAPGGRGKAQVGDQDTDRFPVETISWEEAVEFCRRLSEKAQEKKARRTYRLPTEAEWEYACRAGTKGPFHFGKALSSAHANLNGKWPYGGAPASINRPHTVRVGSFPPNRFGLYDMHGNVWEWCQDRYGNYPAEEQENPRGSTTGSDRVLRGGSWFFRAADCRSARRMFRDPGTQGMYYGFRVACDVKLD
jgi:formylglycine-generating enzyme required for sulfatase activity